MAVLEVLAAGAAVGAAVGLDNMRVSAAIGVLAPSAVRRRWLTWLVASDALALAIGAAAGAAIPVAVSRTSAAAGVVVLVLLAGLAFTDGEGTAPAHFEDLRLIAAVPMLMGLDNLAAGAALAAIGYPPLPTAVVAAIVAALVCLAGFATGSLLRSIAGRRIGQAAALLLCAAALLGVADLG